MRKYVAIMELERAATIEAIEFVVASEREEIVRRLNEAIKPVLAELIGDIERKLTVYLNPAFTGTTE